MGNEGHLARIFVDTGELFNTITRTVCRTLLDRVFKCVFYPGPATGQDVNFVGGYCPNASGDMATIDSEDLNMSAASYNSACYNS